MSALKLKRRVLSSPELPDLTRNVSESLRHGAGVSGSGPPSFPPQNRRALGQSLTQLFPAPKSRGLDRRGFWQHAQLCAELADDVAALCDTPHRNLAYSAALLHDVGRLVLDTVTPAGYPRNLDTPHTQGLLILEAERQELGLDHAVAGKWLAERWELPEAYVAAIWLHHHPAGSLDDTAYPIGLVDVVALADLLATAKKQGHTRGGMLAGLIEDRRKRLKLTDDQVSTLLERTSPAVRSHTEAEQEPVVPVPDAGRLRVLEVRLRCFEALHQMNLRLKSGKARGAVLSVMAETLRDAFGIHSGCCFVADEAGGFLEGVGWSPELPQPQPVFAATEDDADDAVSKAARQLLAQLPGAGSDASWSAEAVQRHGLTAVPLTCEGRRLGQMVLSLDAEGDGAEDDLLGLLSPFAKACGRALERCSQDEELSKQNEGLATAVWKQELAHRHRLRSERLASVSQLASGAAHEINNPLAAISGRAQMLLSRAKTDDDVKALETIVDQSKRISKILTDLMQFARPSDPMLEPHPVTSMLHQVVGMLRDRLERKGVRVVEDYAPALPQVRLDRRQIEQVFLNLILNAEQAMEATPGVLTLRVRPSTDGKSVIVQVQDAGHGIPSSVVGRVFEPFFTTRETTENTGLGLAVCHGIVENHRGAITVHSEEGRGTTCTVTLPAALDAAMPKPAAKTERTPAPAVEASSPKRAERPPQETGPTILVADGDDDLREVLRETLRSRGYATRVAVDGLEAMAAVMGYRLDLVLLDLSIRGYGGESPLQQIRERSPSLPVIGLCGPLAHDDAEEALQLGATRCLQKPFKIETLLAEIRRILSARNVA